MHTDMALFVFIIFLFDYVNLPYQINTLLKWKGIATSGGKDVWLIFPWQLNNNDNNNGKVANVSLQSCLLLLVEILAYMMIHCLQPFFDIAIEIFCILLTLCSYVTQMSHASQITDNLTSCWKMWSGNKENIKTPQYWPWVNGDSSHSHKRPVIRKVCLWNDIMMVLKFSITKLFKLSNLLPHASLLDVILDWEICHWWSSSCQFCWLHSGWSDNAIFLLRMDDYISKWFSMIIW